MEGMRFEAPDSVDAAVALLAAATGEARVLAGGTDLLVQLRANMIEPELIVDIKRIAETRIVKMVLSDVSIAISSGFSSDLVSTTAFRYVAAPRVEQSEADKERDAAKRRVLREDGAVGDYAGGGGTTLVYRTRKKGAVGGSNGWKIVTEKLAEPKTRTELLEMRSKYKSDRHCG